MNERVHALLTAAGRSRWTFGAAVIGLIAVIFVMDLARMFELDYLNPEAMDLPLAVAHTRIARAKGQSMREYMHNDPCWQTPMREEPSQFSGTPRDTVKLEYFALHQSLLAVLYHPFVGLWGVNRTAVHMYSAAYSMILLALFGFYAARAFGRWHALLAILLIQTSLSWLIHRRMAYAAWMPSAVLICGMALLALLYMRTGRRRFLAACAALLGLLYMTAWLSTAFGFAVLALTLALGARRGIVRMVGHSALAATCTLASILLFSVAYAAYCRCPVSRIHYAIYDAVFDRFSTGAVAHVQFSLAGKLGFAFRAMFLDSRTFDHLCKCLEGRPALPAVFGVLFALGVFYGIRQGGPGNVSVLLWALGVFGVLGTLFAYAHRYALIGMPAMALIAANGAISLGRDLATLKWRWLLAAYVVMLGAALAATFPATYRQFYVEYVNNKPRDFEIDRMRGHEKVADWLTKHAPAEETMVVLGDPTMVPIWCFLFNTYGHPYNFIYWSNHFGPGTQPADVRRWEEQALRRYKRIVYAFATQLVGNPQNRQYLNDWRPFMAAHPGLSPVTTYSYAGRPPSLVVFEVTTL